jgi:5-methylcytosine-specific restriction endonuclease McrA
MTRSGEFTRKQRAEMWLRAKGNCEGCGARLKASGGQYDHVIPLSMGGENEVSNGQVLCGPCHGSKTAKEAPRRAKADRNRDKASGAYRRASRPIPGSKASGWKRKLDGTVVRR